MTTISFVILAIAILGLAVGRIFVVVARHRFQMKMYEAALRAERKKVAQCPAREAGEFD